MGERDRRSSRRGCERRHRPVLEADDLRKSYGGRTVVDGVTVRVAGGEVVGLLGPNGAGKTTTFSMVVGLVAPDGGAVLLDGEDVTALPMFRRARRGIGYLPQEPSVFRKHDGRREPPRHPRNAAWHAGGTRGDGPRPPRPLQALPPRALHRGHPLGRRAAAPRDRARPDAVVRDSSCSTSRSPASTRSRSSTSSRSSGTWPPAASAS